jgi:hypothetical protein
MNFYVPTTHKCSLYTLIKGEQAVLSVGKSRIGESRAEDWIHHGGQPQCRLQRNRSGNFDH